jgi:hypothetical protein
MLSDEVFLTYVYMYAYCVLFIFLAIDSKDECAKGGGEVLEYQEEGDYLESADGEDEHLGISKIRSPGT